MAATNPLGLDNWLQQNGNGGDDDGEDVELGRFNQLPASAGPAITTIQNSAEQNAALGGQNIATGVGVVGVVGQSNGVSAGVGVVGACDAGWGMAGVATVSGLIVLDSLADPTDPSSPGWPTNLGVFGVADAVGVYGQSLPGTQAPSSLPQPSTGVGVYGMGRVVGVTGESDAGRGGVFGSANPNIAQLNLEPAVDPTPALPPTGQFGDLYVTVTGGEAAPPMTTMYLCVTPDDPGAGMPAAWAPFLLGAAIQGG